MTALKAIDGNAQSTQAENVSIAELFGLPVDPRLTTRRFLDHSNPHIPELDEDHFFDREMFRDLNAFFQMPRRDALCITGHTATGKTSGVRQYASRTNWPVQEVTCSERMELRDLIGQFVLCADKPGEAPQMKWVDGPLTTAMRYGHILLMNEMNLMPPGELTGLNGVRDGGPLVIPENGGEVVPRHPNFRFVVTANAMGEQAETSHLYGGTMEQNIAFLDGFRVLTAQYLPAEVEEALLERLFPQLPENPTRKGMVKVANEVRAAFVKGTLTVPLSTRSLIRWAGLTLDYRQAENPMEYSLRRSLLNRCVAEEQEAIIRICKDVFGEDQWK